VVLVKAIFSGSSEPESNLTNNAYTHCRKSSTGR
jgi:hypothetical protein